MSNFSMDLSHLRIFLAVLDTTSVTRAAEEVGLTPGAVSQQLRSLANHLGAELFVRSGRKLAPTAEAQKLATHARAILHQVRYRDTTDSERLFRYCVAQAGHRDFFIRKAIGWSLREYAKVAPDAVRTFVAGHSDDLSGLSRREALKNIDVEIANH